MAAKAGNAVPYIRTAVSKYPDLALSLMIGVAGCIVTPITLYRIWQRGPETSMHKNNYKVIRPEDVKDPKYIGTIYN